MMSNSERAEHTAQSYALAIAMPSSTTWSLLIGAMVEQLSLLTNASLEDESSKMNDLCINLMNVRVALDDELSARLEDGDDTLEIAIAAYEAFVASEHISPAPGFPTETELDSLETLDAVMYGFCQYLLEKDIDPQTYIQFQSYVFQEELADDEA